MTFKREISIDGVAVIVATVMLISFVITLNINQNNQEKTIEEHTAELRQIDSTEASLANSISVLTAIVNERTGHAISPPQSMK